MNRVFKDNKEKKTVSNEKKIRKQAGQFDGAETDDEVYCLV